MPRKSTKLRIQQGEELLVRYQSANVHNVWPASKAYKFVSDMLVRLKAGRSWSKRQREYFDACVDAPTPVIESADEELENKLRAAAVTLGSDGAICLEFAQRLRSGRELTEKQAAWADRCISQAAVIEAGEAWTPSPADKVKIALILQLSTTYDGNYWYTHPGSWRKLEKLRKWSEGEKSYITEQDVENGAYAVRGALKKMENPRFRAGDSGWLKSRQLMEDSTGRRRYETVKEFVLVCSDPYVMSGKIVHDAIVSGEHRVLRTDSISKR